MPRKWLLLLALILLGLAAAIYFWLKPGAIAVENIACEDIVQGCRHEEGVLVRAMAVPRVMQAFEMRIVAPDAQSVEADFDMKSMQMGLNRYRFQHQLDGSWRAMVTLPVCVNGRSDWMMQIEVRHASRLRDVHYQLEFKALP